jgi:hypothetical protein
MSDNHLHVSNTPIFDRLLSERGYNPKFPEYLVRPRLSYITPDSWIAKPVPTMTPEKSRPVLKVNFHPLDVMKSYESMEAFVRDRVAEFNRKHPKAFNVSLTSTEEFDGTTTLTIQGTEIEGITFAPKPDWSSLDTGETFVVRGLSETMPPVFRTEPKTEKIPEGLSERQLTLYTSLTRKHDRIIQEQTDKHVNAASTDDTRPQHAIPRPLWISDEEVADEE